MLQPRRKELTSSDKLGRPTHGHLAQGCTGMVVPSVHSLRVWAERSYLVSLRKIHHTVDISK